MCYRKEVCTTWSKQKFDAIVQMKPKSFSVSMYSLSFSAYCRFWFFQPTVAQLSDRVSLTFCFEGFEMINSFSRQKFSFYLLYLTGFSLYQAKGTCLGVTVETEFMFRLDSWWQPLLMNLWRQREGSVWFWVS